MAFSKREKNKRTKPSDDWKSTLSGDVGQPVTYVIKSAS